MFKRADHETCTSMRIDRVSSENHVQIIVIIEFAFSAALPIEELSFNSHN